MEKTASTSSFPKHFDGTKFYNPDAAEPRGLLDVLRWKLTSRAEPSPKVASDVRQSIPPTRVEGAAVLFTLVNHSTVLAQMDGSNILTDPIWSERASPAAWAGPRRHRIPGVRREDLPPIDVVLISHNHYDHLDLPTLRWLAEGDAIFIVPRGLARLLQREQIGPVHELDWGEEQSIGRSTVYSVPAVHFSARSLFDRNRTLWCGYVIKTPHHTLYFAGDTAFGGHFADIRQRFGPPDVSLLPIGAYLPRWFMSSVHMDPEQAIRAHHILSSTASIAIHHGTFQLADDGIDTASKQLEEAGRPESFLVLKNGQSFSIAR